jgi:hypothetical protein
MERAHASRWQRLGAPFTGQNAFFLFVVQVTV